MPLPYGWDHEAIAAKLRTLSAEGYPSKQRYAIAMESAREDWRDSHGGAPMPGHLKKSGGVGARRVLKGQPWSPPGGVGRVGGVGAKRRNRSSGAGRRGTPMADVAMYTFESKGEAQEFANVTAANRIKKKSGPILNYRSASGLEVSSGGFRVYDVSVYIPTWMARDKADQIAGRTPVDYEFGQR